jgi:two-component system nitrogen regulation response regulator NtrX
LVSHGSSARLYRSDERCELIGATPLIERVRQEVAQAARTDAKVMITGESGSGKEVIARSIHENSRRCHRPMVPINCGAVVESVLESELFGHARGSFTGADRERVGHLERAHRGTVLLDEVGEMSARMQGALLRFLETGEVQRVGADRMSVAVDVRIISATNRDLGEAITRKEFREDLFYRLNVIHIQAPALRDRAADIPALLDHFAGLFSRKYGLPQPRFSADALAALQRHTWPGNVRELRNVVERVVIYSNEGEVTEARLPREILQPSPIASATTANPEPVAMSRRADELYTSLRTRRDSFWGAVYAPFMARDLTRSDVRSVVTRGLSETRGNYRALTPLFNMPEHDYKRFLNFLKKHNCHVAFQPFRTVHVDSPAAEHAA